MGVMFLILPLALIFAGIALWAFIAAVKKGQFDDLTTPAVRMLHDDDVIPGAAPPAPPSPRAPGGS